MRYEHRKSPDKAFKRSQPTDPHWCVVRITDDPANLVETLAEYRLSEADASKKADELNRDRAKV